MSQTLNALPQFKRGECLVAVIGDEDTVVGMLLSGFGQVASRKNPNFFVVDTSLHRAARNMHFSTNNRTASMPGVHRDDAGQD